MPAMNPITMAGIGLTNPAAGVIATRPATAPEMAPKALGFPLLFHSATVQPAEAVAAAKCVATKALDARLPEESALPALKPNQPTQSKQAPIKLKTTLWGGTDASG